MNHRPSGSERQRALRVPADRDEDVAVALATYHYPPLVPGLLQEPSDRRRSNWPITGAQGRRSLYARRAADYQPADDGDNTDNNPPGGAGDRCRPTTWPSDFD